VRINKRKRPPETRNIVLGIRLKESEHALILAAAESSGETMAERIRRVLLDDARRRLAAIAERPA
jgi:uncharacterized protein (DUF1778 family)